MKRILISMGIIMALMLFVACKGSEESTVIVSSCEEFCAGEAHTDCDGQADITGTYPDCECGWVCNEASGDGATGDDSVDDTADASGGEPTVDDYKVSTPDGKFWVRVGEDNMIENGKVIYFAGDEEIIADKVILGGSGVADLERAEVWLKKGFGESKLKAWMHLNEEGADMLYDASLRSGDSGTLTFKLFKPGDVEIKNELSIKIAPE
ncbi:MAG: hypothetical protein KKG59_02305 [Nanoarchaeota archaeon]|nr:hypothetical protein [Nanoarchaeota archaeon]